MFLLQREVEKLVESVNTQLFVKKGQSCLYG